MKKSTEEKKKKEKLKKVSYIPIAGVLGEAADYHVYQMTVLDKCIAAVIGFAGCFAVIYIFFRSGIVSALTGCVGILFSQNIYADYKKNSRTRILLFQFKDLLESLAASYSAGENTLAAFSDARSDMISIYGDEADIVKELSIIIDGLNNNVMIEVLLDNFAKRSGLDDVQSFASVFEVANRQGGNLKKVMSETREIINDKIEIEMEIETMLAGNKNELKIMMIMPLVILLCLNGMGTMSVVNNTLPNVLVKIFCIGLFIVAYKIGMKVIDIKV